MERFSEKFKLIFIPYLLIALTTIGTYTFFHWLLLIKTITFSVDEEVTNFFIPFALPWIPMLIWLTPRVKLLELKNKSGKGDPLMGYLMIAWFAISFPAIIAQEYLVTASGKLTDLGYISQINKLPPTKYYTLKHYYIDKKLVRVKSVFEVSGKYNANFDMSIYAPCPIYDKKEDQGSSISLDQKAIITHNDQHQTGSFNIPGNPLFVINGKIVPKEELASISPTNIASISVLKGASAIALYGNAANAGVVLVTLKSEPPNQKNISRPSAWLSIVYRKTISNNLSQAEKDERYKQFAKESESDFNSKQLGDFIYLDRIGVSEKLKNFIKAIKANGADDNIPIIILSPVNEPFSARTGSKLQWLFGSLGIGSVIFLIGLLFKPLKNNAAEVNLTEASKKDRDTLLIWIKGLFIPKENHVATQLLIATNLLVFIIMVCCGLGFVSFNGADLLNWGANYRPNINDGEYWRLLTNIFLHGGVMHVLLNMYGLFFVGVFLEPVLGSGKFAVFYLITGVLASIASVWWHPATVSVGASGAIFGIYGIFFALLTTNFFPKDFKRSFLLSTSIFIGYNLIYGLTGGIDNAAHIGGLLSGLLLGYVTYPTLNKLTEKEAKKDNTQEIIDELNGKKVNE